ncbi:hypothetical protein MC885_005172 [Smutsia gigantea]|nr:hypothetical protein MC885_005172 [Smutsia gigantea]
MKILSVKKSSRQWRRSWWKRKLHMPRPRSSWPGKRRSCSLPLERWRSYLNSWRKRSWPLKRRSPASRAEPCRSPARRTSSSPNAMKLSLTL